MGKTTGISWTDATFNPWWGCTRVSEACRNCYAETFAKRVGQKVWGVQAERRFFGDKHWNDPLRWNGAAKSFGREPFGGARHERPRVFCASMADVFEGRADLDPQRRRLWELIDRCDALDWLLLTKRPENIAKMLPTSWLSSPRPHVWLGTTVEDQGCANTRIPHLLDVRAAVHFLSVEPMLEPIDVESSPRLHVGAGGRVDWIIVGGESGGKHYRVMDHAWARFMRDQAHDIGAAFLFKQSSGFLTGADPWLVEADGSRFAWHQFPKTPFNPAGTFTAPERIAA